MGVGIVALVASGADSQGMTRAGAAVIVSLAALCLVTGSLVIGTQVMTRVRVANGTHPLLVALRLGDRKFVCWYFERIFEMKRGGKTFQVWAYCANGKCYVVNLGFAKEKIPEVVAFLRDRFPSATVGFSPENEAAYRAAYRLRSGSGK